MCNRNIEHAHLDSDIRVAPPLAHTFHCSSDNLFKVLGQSETVNFLDQRICRADEDGRFETIDQGCVLFEGRV